MSKYSSNLVKIVKQMLMLDPNARPSARTLLSSSPLGDIPHEYNCEDCDIEESLTKNNSLPASLINSIPSLQKRAGIAGLKDNVSIGVNSKGSVNQNACDSPMSGTSPRKEQFPSLYKQSLMKGRNKSRDLLDLANNSKASSRAMSTTAASKISSNKSSNVSKGSIDSGSSPKFANSCLNSPMNNQNARRASNLIPPGLSPFARAELMARAEYNARSKDV